MEHWYSKRKVENKDHKRDCFKDHMFKSLEIMPSSSLKNCIFVESSQ
jgi:hypothetical protein